MEGKKLEFFVTGDLTINGAAGKNRSVVKRK